MICALDVSYENMLLVSYFAYKGFVRSNAGLLHRPQIIKLHNCKPFDVALFHLFCLNILFFFEIIKSHRVACPLLLKCDVKIGFGIVSKLSRVFQHNQMLGISSCRCCFVSMCCFNNSHVLEPLALPIVLIPHWF